MPRSTARTFPREEQQAKALGQRLRNARLRRHIPIGEMAARVGVNRMTQRRLEQGDVSASLAVLLRTLSVLGLAKEIDQIAAEDELGRRLADMELSERPRQRGKGSGQ